MCGVCVIDTLYLRPVTVFLRIVNKTQFVQLCIPPMDNPEISNEKFSS